MFFCLPHEKNSTFIPLIFSAKHNGRFVQGTGFHIQRLYPKNIEIVDLTVLRRCEVMKVEIFIEFGKLWYLLLI